MAPHIQKAQRVTGRNLVFRNARETDASYILQLRTDGRKGLHLSDTPKDLVLQRLWLCRYAQDDMQAYFVIEDKQSGQPLGTVRLYDARSMSFCWGSWVIQDGAPPSYAFESALMVYRYALGLGFTSAHFDVRKANEKVWRFHERFGARRCGETDLDHLYTIDHEAIAASLARYARYLPNEITVVPLPAPTRLPKHPPAPSRG